MRWDDLRFLLAADRRGSLKGAARLLGVDATTVGRRLAALAAAVDAKLLVRAADRLVTTAAGRELVARAARVEVEILAAERALEGADDRLAGPLRVTAGDGLVHAVVAPGLAELRAAHPGLAIELRAETRLLDLSRREADVALRLVRPKEPALVARRVGAMAFAIYGEDGYLHRRGLPRSAEALRAHDWIGFDPSLDRLPQVRWLGAKVPGIRYVVRANTTMAQVRACAGGCGLALLPEVVAAAEPGLRRVLPRLAGPSRELWGVSHADLRGNPRVRLFLDWFARRIAEAAGPRG